MEGVTTVANTSYWRPKVERKNRLLPRGYHNYRNNMLHIVVFRLHASCRLHTDCNPRAMSWPCRFPACILAPLA